MSLAITATASEPVPPSAPPGSAATEHAAQLLIGFQEAECESSADGDFALKSTCAGKR